MKVVCKKCNHLVLSTDKSCPNCDHEVGQNFNRIPAKDYIQASFGVLVIIGLFGGCVYQIGYPYTCQQAKDEHSKAYNAPVSREIEGSGLNYLNNLKQAADEMYEKCP